MSFRGFPIDGSGREPPPQRELTEAEARILEKLAAKVVEWRMTVPAILFLESVKPLNFLGAQMMIFFEPFVQTIFNLKDYDTFRELMEGRENVERLLLKIEELDAVALQKEKEDRTQRKAGRRGWFARLRGKPAPAPAPTPTPPPPEDIPDQDQSPDN